MGKRAHSRTRGLGVGAVVLGLIAALFVVIPALASAPPNAVRLHLGTDGDRFTYGGTTQSLTSSGCKITSPEALIDLSTSSGKYPGLVSDSIGVKGSSSTGTPCGQIDGSEYLKLSRGSAISGRKFIGVRLDLEMTGNALVKLTLASSTRSVTYQLQTGRGVTSSQSSEAGYDRTVPYLVSSGPGDEVDACAAPNSSGPNSGSNDNCQWSVMPGFEFDTISLSTSCGTVALEGGGDFGNNPDYDTLLYLSNTAPTANPDSFATNEDVAVQGNVLSNDTDADGNPLSATLNTPPSNGSVTVAPTGAFTYEPDDDWFGTDSFTYRASDGTTSSTATATITVAAVNDPPVGTNGSATTSEDTTVTLTVATDVDSPDLDSDCTSDGGGTIEDNGDGTIDFTPPDDLNGSLTITCTVTDDQGASTSPSALVVLGVSAVNDPPVAEDDVADVNADDSVVIAVLDNDSDVDEDPLSVTDIAAVSPEGASAIANPDGTVTYTPPVGYDGAGSFTYRASDGEASSNVATVDVTVYPVLCSLETVSDEDGDLTGAFTRLSDEYECKRYDLDASDENDTIIFAPLGGDFVSYRGELTFDAEAAPGDGEVSLLLRYDPTGGTDYQPVLWCVDPTFDEDGMVIGATLPDGESWCVASADTRGGPGGLVITWQVYGFDDPRFTR